MQIVKRAQMELISEALVVNQQVLNEGRCWNPEWITVTWTRRGVIEASWADRTAGKAFLKRALSGRVDSGGGHLFCKELLSFVMLFLSYLMAERRIGTDGPWVVWFCTLLFTCVFCQMGSDSKVQRDLPSIICWVLSEERATDLDTWLFR